MAVCLHTHRDGDKMGRPNVLGRRTNGGSLSRNEDDSHKSPTLSKLALPLIASAGCLLNHAGDGLDGGGPGALEWELNWFRN